MSMKLNPMTNDWTRPKYMGYKPLHLVKPKTGIRIVLAEYLEKIGLSQRSLAELCDLSQPVINEMCTNTTQLINMANFIRVLNVLGCTLEDILISVPYKDSGYTTDLGQK